jgi:uncharacterized membrane protein YesL
MGKWYNKIFVGNPNKEDFSSKDLPKTRFEQFVDVLKLRFGGLVVVNLLFVLFAIPLMLWVMYFWFMLTHAEDLATAMGYVNDPNLWMLFFVVNIPLYMIMGPAQAGLYYCLRNWIWNERATAGEHFWKEFKRSWKRSIALNFFNSALFYAGFWWLVLCDMNMDKSPMLFKFISLTIIVVLVLYYMSTIYQYPQLVTYDLKVKQIIKNSFIYLIVQFPRTLLATVCYGGLMVLSVVFGQVLLAVALGLGISVVCLGNMILSDFLFDKYVNAPEKRRKGMAPKE